VAEAEWTEAHDTYSHLVDRTGRSTQLKCAGGEEAWVRAVARQQRGGRGAGVFGQAGTGGDAIGRARPIREAAAAAAAAAAASWPLLSYSGQWAR
jgi:hypothetical protein